MHRGAFLMARYVEFIMRAEFAGNYCLGQFPCMAIFLSFLASWLFEISIYHGKNPPQKQESPGTMGQEYFNGTML